MGSEYIEKTKTSETTIAKVMKKLQKFLKKIQNGLWQVSPNIIMNIRVKLVSALLI